MLVAVVMMAMTVAVTVIVMIGIGGSGAVTEPVFVRVGMHRRKLHSTRSGLLREVHLALSGHLDTLPS